MTDGSVSISTYLDWKQIYWVYGYCVYYVFMYHYDDNDEEEWDLLAPTLLCGGFMWGIESDIDDADYGKHDPYNLRNDNYEYIHSFQILMNI